jgi:hypothetical protein
MKIRFKNLEHADHDIWDRDEDEALDLTKKKIDKTMKDLTKEIEFYEMS